MFSHFYLKTSPLPLEIKCYVWPMIATFFMVSTFAISEEWMVLYRCLMSNFGCGAIWALAIDIKTSWPTTDQFSNHFTVLRVLLYLWLLRGVKPIFRMERHCPYPWVMCPAFALNKKREIKIYIICLWQLLFSCPWPPWPWFPRPVCIF